MTFRVTNIKTYQTNKLKSNKHLLRILFTCGSSSCCGRKWMILWLFRQKSTLPPDESSPPSRTRFRRRSACTWGTSWPAGWQVCWWPRTRPGPGSCVKPPTAATSPWTSAARPTMSADRSFRSLTPPTWRSASPSTMLREFLMLTPRCWPLAWRWVAQWPTDLPSCESYKHNDLVRVPSVC